MNINLSDRLIAIVNGRENTEGWNLKTHVYLVPRATNTACAYLEPPVCFSTAVEPSICIKCSNSHTACKRGHWPRFTTLTNMPHLHESHLPSFGPYPNVSAKHKAVERILAATISLSAQGSLREQSGEKMLKLGGIGRLRGFRFRR